MVTPGERAADQFGEELRALHAKGDRLLGGKVDLVQESLAIRESLRGLLPEWNALGAQVPSGSVAQAYQSMAEIIEHIVGQVDSLDQDWEKLERARKHLYEQRKLFDSLHLDRMRRNLKLAARPGIQPLRTLDELLVPLKGDTVKHGDRAFLIKDEWKTGIDSLPALVADQIEAALAAEVSALLQRFRDDWENFGRWVNALDQQYSGSVYTLDDQYREVRMRMEEWEPPF